MLRLNKSTFWKDKKLEKPYQRKVKSYNIYKLFMEGSNVYKLNRRVKLSEYKEHFKINKTNKVVGWTPDYLGSSKSKLIKSKNYISELTLKCSDKIFSTCSESFTTEMFNSLKSERIVYSPGYDTSNAHLREYFKDNVTDYSVKKRYLKSLINLILNGLKHPVLVFIMIKNSKNSLE